MRKRLFLSIVIIISMCLITSACFATSINNLSEEEIIQQYEEIKKERDRIKASRDAKIEIIKNNNVVIANLKVDALDAIATASVKVDDLLQKIQSDKIKITEELIMQLTDLLEFMKTSNNTINEQSTKLNSIVKDLKIKGYDSSVLTVLDDAIEKQNSIIVSYKQIISKLNAL